MKVVVQRGPGVNPCPDVIVDPLCVLEHVGLARGKTFIYQEGFHKDIIAVTMPYRGVVLNDALVDIQDTSLSRAWKGRNSGWSLEAHRQEGGGLEVSHTLTLQRYV